MTSPERLRLDLRTIRTTRLAVCDGELDPRWSAVAMPGFGSFGDLLAAVELRVRHLARDVPGLRSSLIVAAGALSRELSHNKVGIDTRPSRSFLPGQDGRRRSRAAVVRITDAAGRRG